MKQGLPEKKFNPASVIEQVGVVDVDDGSVDSVLGREPSAIKRIQLEEGGGSIDLICAIGGTWLAVASANYPVIHIFDKGLNLVTRLIGHTMGITCLFDYGNRLFSGSIDRTIKLWDVQTGELQFAYHGHTEKVTCLYLSSGSENEVFLFSGAEDKTVRAWDVRRKRAVFGMVSDSEGIPKILNFFPETNELTVLVSAPDRTEAYRKTFTKLTC
jgi:WD40 repeat protein